MEVVIIILIGLGIVLLVSATAGSGTNFDRIDLYSDGLNSSETHRQLWEMQQHKEQEKLSKRSQEKERGQSPTSTSPVDLEAG